MLLIVNRFLLYVDTSPNLDGRRRLAVKYIHYTRHDEEGWLESPRGESFAS